MLIATSPCRNSRGACRYSVAGQIHYSQQLEIRNSLILKDQNKPVHCAQDRFQQASKTAYFQLLSAGYPVHGELQKWLQSGVLMP